MTIKRKMFFTADHRKRCVVCLLWLLLFSTITINCGGSDDSNTPASSSANDITAFAFTAAANSGLPGDAWGIISGTNISVTIPYGASRSALVATFTTTGFSVLVGSTLQASGFTPNDFTSPKTYTVTAVDGSTKAYTVTVTVAPSFAKDITSFIILGIPGTIDANAVTLTVPSGTNPSSLTPTIVHTGASVSPASGVPNNFTSPKTYTVTAADGSTKAYTVTVTVAPSFAKDITSFTILGIAGTIGANTVTLTVPYGTNPSSLTPTIVHTGASVNPASGVLNNFTNPVTYTVTAQDGSTKSYIVTVTVAPAPTGQIIADHTVVDKYNTIPQYWINEVKKMWFNLPGESHATAYRKGVNLLAAQEPKFAVVTTENGPPTPYRTDALRVSGLVRNQYNSWDSGAGEDDWYTNAAGITRIKNHITYCNTNNLTIAAIGFGWCWDMTWVNPPGGTIDPVYNVRWAGTSDGGPNGNLRWGLDAGDTALTGNTVNMDTYLAATESYIAHLAANGYTNTKIVFTTGPVDGYSGENGYQRQLKHEHIRNYVKADASRILFDYADILAHNNNGVQYTLTYDGKPYQMIHPDNMVDLGGGYSEDGDHIGQVGALRLAKAQWWLLARIAGWDGNP